MSAIRNLIAEANSAMAVLQDFQIKDDRLNQQIVELQQRLSGFLQDRAELVPLLEEARGKEKKAQEDLRAFYQQELRMAEAQLRAERRAAVKAAPWPDEQKVAPAPASAPPLPASPAQSPAPASAPGAPKKGGRRPYSPEQKVAAAGRSAQKKATRQRLIAEGNAEAIAEQAKINARVAKMQAGLKVWKAGQKMPELEGSGSEADESLFAFA